MTESDTLSTRDLGDGIVELQLGRGPVNALSADFLMGFAALITRLGADDAVRCIILSSPFKVFSAGLDLKEAQHFDLEQQQAIVRGLNEGFLALYACPKPVVASIGGAAIAGGLFFVLASDRRVAMTKSSFGLAEVRVGADFPVGPLEIAKASPLAPSRRVILALLISSRTTRKTWQPIRSQRRASWPRFRRLPMARSSSSSEAKQS